MTSVVLKCLKCKYTTKRPLLDQPGSDGVHETSSEPGRCPKGHGELVREDGVWQSLTTKNRRPMNAKR